VRVPRGRGRGESERFISLRSHYGFDSLFCRPGLAGSHEKGGVEGEIGWFRRRHLVPVPKVSSLVELNELLAVADAHADVVAVEIRRLAQVRPRTSKAAASPPSRGIGQVVSLTQRRLADPDATVVALPPDRRPLPTVTAYDELLPRRVATASTQAGAAATPTTSQVS
jgi:hypothetical protein